MAKLDGGIFSRPRGKTGGIVFGAARTRQGKVATARQLVPPSNPRTPAQQTQRSIFKESLEIVRKIGKGVYGSDFNRSISQLPGFQSMMSILMSSMDDNFVLSPPPKTNLGSLHYPDTFQVGPGGSAGTVTYSWSTELGPNGTDQDEQELIVIEANAGPTPKEREVYAVPKGVRTDGGDTGSDLKQGEPYLFGSYFRGAGSATGFLSSVNWVIASAG